MTELATLATSNEALFARFMTVVCWDPGIILPVVYRAPSSRWLLKPEFTL